MKSQVLVTCIRIPDEIYVTLAVQTFAKRCGLGKHESQGASLAASKSISSLLTALPPDAPEGSRAALHFGINAEVEPDRRGMYIVSNTMGLLQRLGRGRMVR